MNNLDLSGYQKRLESTLTKGRVTHSTGVMYTAASLAMRYALDINQAMIAGYLHDCGKYGTLEQQMERCRKRNISLSPSELKNPALVHTKLGAFMAEHDYGVKDPAILDAIR